MTIPNAQLQTALDHFSAQPNVTPAQHDQLRAAIVQNPDLLLKLNQDAVNGQLRGFALPQNGTPPNLVGTYDLASGVITLPAGDFQSEGTTPGADLAASLRVQNLSLRFAHSTYLDANGTTQPVTQDMITNLQSTLNGSPVLADQIKLAVTPPEAGQSAPLESFASLSGTVAGGTYNPTTHTMSLPPSVLAIPTAHFRSADLTFVLAHEIQHGLNDREIQRARTLAYEHAKQIAQDDNPINDYTAPIAAAIQSGRDDEAKAQIAGWNALLSREKVQNPSADLIDMMALSRASGDRTTRVLDFVQPNRLDGRLAEARAGLTFNADGTMSMTPGNVAQLGHNYFDKPPRGTPNVPIHATTGLGHYGESDYPNYYGSNVVGNVITIDRVYARAVNGVAPQMHVNMDQLHLREDLMERNGITITHNPERPQPYFDTSHTPPTLRHFDHTHNPEHANEQNSHQYVPVVPSVSQSTRQPVEQYFTALRAGDEQAARAASTAFATPDRWQQAMAEAEERVLARQGQIPGREAPLFAQAMEHLERLGSKAGGYLDRVQMEGVAGTVAYQAKLKHLPSIDALTPVQEGGHLIATSVDPGNPAVVRAAFIEKADAAMQPLEQTLRQLTIETQRHQDQATLHAQERQMDTQQQSTSR
ncbi:XVIPCD domain-containing protein [Stenotrophomonas sp. BIGb0135]|uniref:XVIPCD domain-containing protein n=1 Tax=Stenotrophomonas sp. BIGb0135 TaxID=2940620 RepID=UPI002166FC32|nr:XVIPCD domain-containing protein [Stenotrophomonas sp. BIGb0135]MCS4233669.1 hypothetical protein [Stenotrophomonas sp. BIGb0135]